ncbi:tetratricopeptide repeat protein [Paraglaciecola agarilytica]|uniref:GSCFA domain-containing protein n=1 Tax=Paraglaciecola chathamensis TaxID=368405 RepID=UPI001C0860F5|nr:GSCFA domain-containing protein [Paraglaciecola agarilytica]MBU3019366.1 tetratricopeptide repeat protein [Paraglaciecola agarilytica]
MNSFNEALELHRASQYKDAEASLTKYTHENQHDEKGFSYLGCALRCQGKYAEAVTAYEKALHLEPNYIWPHYYKILCKVNESKHVSSCEIQLLLDIAFKDASQVAAFIQKILHLAILAKSKEILIMLHGECVINDFFEYTEARDHIVLFYKLGFYLRQFGAAELAHTYFDILDKLDFLDEITFNKDELVCIYRAKSYSLERWKNRIQNLEGTVKIDAKSKVALIKNKNRSFRKYPLKISEFNEISSFLGKYLFYSASTKLPLCSSVVAIGSCFAANISNSLNDIGVKTQHLALSESTNNTYSTLNLLKGIFNNKRSNDDFFYKNFINAKMIIITVGVSLGFFKQVLGKEVLVDTGVDIRKILKREREGGRITEGENYYRKISKDENFSNLIKINNLLRSYNKEARLIYTLSPIPLEVSFTTSSVFEEDCLSKSTLKVALSDMISQEKEDGNIYYWPSFEAIKWLGAHHSENVFNFGDSRHINPDNIKMIMEYFKESL